MDTAEPEELVEDVQNNVLEPGESMVFSTEGFQEPKDYNATILRKTNGNKVLTSTGKSVSFNRQGEFILVVSARWEAGDIFYAYPIEITEEE